MSDYRACSHHQYSLYFFFCADIASACETRWSSPPLFRTTCFSLSSVSYLCFHASLLNARLDCFAATTAHILFRYLEAQEYIGGLLLCNQGFFFPLLKAGID